MINYEFKENEIMTIDLHNMGVCEAKLFLTLSVATAPKEIKEIVVIHGYHNGTVLMKMVREEFKSKKVHRKFLSLNQGITSLILS